MPLHPWQFHHLALGNCKGCGQRISSLQRAVRDIMGEDTTHFLQLAQLVLGAQEGPRVRVGWPHVQEGNEEHFLLLPLLVFHPKRANQRHRWTCRLPSKPTTGLGIQGPHRHAPEDLPMEDPNTILQKHHSRLHIGNLAIPMHVPVALTKGVLSNFVVGLYHWLSPMGIIVQLSTEMLTALFAMMQRAQGPQRQYVGVPCAGCGSAKGGR